MLNKRRYICSWFCWLNTSSSAVITFFSVCRWCASFGAIFEN